MKISDYKGYEVHIPTSGGKAGKGHAVTSNVQLRKDSCIVKQFRFIVADAESRERASQRAREWVDKVLPVKRRSNESWRRQLHHGDEVKWTDPNSGLCSRTGTILVINYHVGTDAADITWEDGTVTAVLLNELS